MGPADRAASRPPSDDLLEAARDEARVLLAGDGARLVHSLAVADCAVELSPSVAPADRTLLVVAALLHDVGYSDLAVDTGFHPVDGARLLHAHGWSDEVCTLVAHHSGARFVAAARGELALLEPYSFVEGPVTDALTAADQTIGPDGSAVRVEERMAEMLRRHGPDSPQAKAHGQRAPYLKAAVARVEARLAARGRAHATTPSTRQEDLV